MFIKTNLVRIITFGFAAGITLFPFVLVRPGVKLNRRLVIHERIHIKQQLELLVIPFYLIYLFEFLIRFVYFKNHFKAYRQISFEQEAYENEENPNYLNNRRRWSWIKYL